MTKILSKSETVLSPRQVLINFYDAFKGVYGLFLKRPTGDPKEDKAILKGIERMHTWMENLDYAFIRKIRKDANLDSASYEKLKELEAIAKEIKDGKYEDIHEQHYLYHTSKKVWKAVRGIAAKSKKTGEKKAEEVKKEQEDLEKKKGQVYQMLGQQYGGKVLPMNKKRKAG